MLDKVRPFQASAAGFLVVHEGDAPLEYEARDRLRPNITTNSSLCAACRTATTAQRRHLRQRRRHVDPVLQIFLLSLLEIVLRHRPLRQRCDVLEETVPVHRPRHVVAPGPQLGVFVPPCIVVIQ